MTRREGSKRREYGAAASLAPFLSIAATAAAAPFALVSIQHSNATSLCQCRSRLISLKIVYAIHLMKSESSLYVTNALVAASSSTCRRRYLNARQHSSSSRHCKAQGTGQIYMMIHDFLPKRARLGSQCNGYFVV